jgi:polyhydroxyalkanoate synthesis regulator phasin
MNMTDSGAHSLETDRMQQVIDKQERDIAEQSEAIQILKDEVYELRQRLEVSH